MTTIEKRLFKILRGTGLLAIAGVALLPYALRWWGADIGAYSNLITSSTFIGVLATVAWSRMYMSDGAYKPLICALMGQVLLVMMFFGHSTDIITLDEAAGAMALGFLFVSIFSFVEYMEGIENRVKAVPEQHAPSTETPTH